MFATSPTVMGFIKAGRMRPLAVSKREASASIPGIPGAEEAGLPGFESTFWFGLYVPAGTPTTAVQRLHAAAAKGLAKGLLRLGEPVSEQQLAELVFVPGFSTAERVTEIAGRGVGMDVVRNEVSGLGGRVEIESRSGAGARFTIRLPLTTAVTQTVLVRSGARTCAHFCG